MDSDEREILGKLSATIDSIKENLETQRKENREDHKQIFNQLEEISTRVIRVEGISKNNKEEIESHREGHWKWFGTVLTSAGVLSGVVAIILSHT